jgi:hypothetical protein
MARPPEEFYWEQAPTEGVDLRPWDEEVLADTKAARADSQLRLLLGSRTLALLDRVATSPQRSKLFERVSRAQIVPVEFEDADDGWYLDTKTGRKVVYEDQGDPPYWIRETAFPPDAFTIGEMVELEARLWGAGEAFAQAAEAGLLDGRQRKAAMGVVAAADNLQLRITIKKWHPDQATRDRVKRDALNILAGDDDSPPTLTLVRKLKHKLLQ